MQDVVVVDSVRSGLAKSFRGKLNMTRPDDLLAFCIDELLRRNPKVDPATVEDVITGVANAAGPHGNNISRMAVMLSQLPVSASAMTIGRACSSGLNAIAIASNQIASGYCDIAIAGGVESISASMAVKRDYVKNPILEKERPDIYLDMGPTAEIVASRYGVTRNAQDEYAVLSQQRTAAAQDSGLFDDEIAAMNVEWGKLVDKESGEIEVVQGTLDRDECNRPGTTLSDLSRLSPVFDKDGGTVTAGNSSQFSDGASVTLLMSEKKANELGLTPMGYFRGYVVSGCEPDEMGIGPVFAIPKLLERSGLTLNNVDLVELNEAFASQCLYCRDTLEIDPDIYNVNGGSISIGHPFGMTGSRMAGHLLRELNRRNKKYGIVSMCIGHGMGAASLFEAIN